MDQVVSGWATGALVTSLTFFIQLGLNFLTGAWPERPTGVGYAAALVIGIGGAFLLAVANGIVLTQQTAAQLVAVGVIAAGAAAGVNSQAVKAEAQRAALQARSLLDEYRGPERRSKI